jgi:putative FmdB family regulatory protein
LPTYEYHCDSCEKNFDVVQSFQDDALTACPTCGSPVRKVFGNVGIVFKGSGFYKTDSRSGGATKATSTDGSSSESSGSDNSGSDGTTPVAAPSGDAPSKAASTESTTKVPAPSAPEKAAKSSAKDGTS